jgi:hypothetical protein
VTRSVRYQKIGCRTRDARGFRGELWNKDHAGTSSCCPPPAASVTLSDTCTIRFQIPPERTHTPGEFMQQRRPRLGDIVDDYCPRERRITNHAIVAMIDDEVKQTRCTTCDADHEYKQAKLPTQRKKKNAVPALNGEPAIAAPRKHPPAVAAEPADPPAPEIAAAPDALPPDPVEPVEPADPDMIPTETMPQEDEGPVHRPLIRATLPRPEGQPPDRKFPDFTVRQPGVHGVRGFNANSNGHRGSRGARHSTRGPHGNAGQQRLAGPRQPSGQRQNPGRPGQGGQSRPGRPGGHESRQGSGHGRGRKRGR